MGIFDYIWKSLGPEARKELAKQAAQHAVKSAGDAVYRKADEIRRQVSGEKAPPPVDGANDDDDDDARDEAEERREREAQARAAETARQRAAQAAVERQAAKVRDAKAVDDELAALKSRVAAEKKKK